MLNYMLKMHLKKLRFLFKETTLFTTHFTNQHVWALTNPTLKKKKKKSCQMRNCEVCFSLEILMYSGSPTSLSILVTAVL